MKHNIILSKQTKTVSGTVQLTGSKSECNRALIIEALSKGKVKVENMSDAADAVTLAAVLNSKVKSQKSKVLADDKSEIEHPKSEINIGPAGTAMRFLTAYLTLQDDEVILTGSERMKQRPIGILVDALRKLGANIGYEENEGFPPLRIKGGFEQLTNSITI